MIEAPWTDEQVDKLNRYQQLGNFHEFTCLNSHGDLSRTLIATRDGWICPNCDYKQTWAHSAMLKMGENKS